MTPDKCPNEHGAAFADRTERGWHFKCNSCGLSLDIPTTAEMRRVARYHYGGPIGIETAVQHVTIGSHG